MHTFCFLLVMHFVFALVLREREKNPPLAIRVWCRSISTMWTYESARSEHKYSIAKSVMIAFGGNVSITQDDRTNWTISHCFLQYLFYTVERCKGIGFFLLDVVVCAKQRSRKKQQIKELPNFFLFPSKPFFNYQSRKNSRLPLKWRKTVDFGFHLNLKWKKRVHWIKTNGMTAINKLTVGSPSVYGSVCVCVFRGDAIITDDL